MSPTSFIMMQANHLMADRTFCVERVESSSSQEFYELDYPYGQNTQGRLSVIFDIRIREQPAESRS